MPAALTEKGKLEVARFEELIEVTDVGSAFYALDRSYDGFRKLLLRSGRLDLVAKLSDWKRADAVRLRHALGLQWQA